MKHKLIVFSNKIWICKPNVEDIKADYPIFPFFTVEHLKEYFDTCEMFHSLMKSLAGDMSHFIYLDVEHNFLHRDLLKFYDEVLPKNEYQSYVDGYYEINFKQE